MLTYHAQVGGLRNGVARGMSPTSVVDVEIYAYCVHFRRFFMVKNASAARHLLDSAGGSLHTFKH